MERYDLWNGKSFVIVRTLGTETCTVYQLNRKTRETDSEPAYTGNYSGCRRFIDAMRKTGRA